MSNGASSSAIITIGQNIVTAINGLANSLLQLASARNSPVFVAGSGISLTGQIATIANINLNSSPIAVSAMYRISYVIEITTAGTGGTLQLAVSWTDDAGVHTGINLGAAMNLNALSSASTVFIERLLSGTNISFSMTLAGVTGNPQYAFYAKLESLG